MPLKTVSRNQKTIDVVINNTTYTFNEVPLQFKVKEGETLSQRVKTEPWRNFKTSKTVRYYFNHSNPNNKIRVALRNINDRTPISQQQMDQNLGTFIAYLKQNNRASELLHDYGDREYINFDATTQVTNTKGLYLWVVANTIKYVGKATQSNGLRGRLSEYKGVTAYMCSIDGNSQTCRTNYLLRLAVENGTINNVSDLNNYVRWFVLPLSNGNIGVLEDEMIKYFETSQQSDPLDPTNGNTTGWNRVGGAVNSKD
jgi:hypothetical protein